MAYIEFNNVFKVYKMGEVEINALSNTSFKINKGELVCILDLLVLVKLLV